MLWTALVAGCGLLGRTAYYGLVLAAAKDAVAGNRLLPEIASEARTLPWRLASMARPGY